MDKTDRLRFLLVQNIAQRVSAVRQILGIRQISGQRLYAGDGTVSSREVDDGVACFNKLLCRGGADARARAGENGDRLHNVLPGYVAVQVTSAVVEGHGLISIPGFCISC